MGSDKFAQLRMAMLPVGESVWRPWGVSRTKRSTQSTTHTAEHLHTAHSTTHTKQRTYTQHTTHNAQHLPVEVFAASSFSSALQLTLTHALVLRCRAGYF